MAAWRWAPIILGPPLAWAGYTFLRDDELEGYTGVNLASARSPCGLVYALLWGVYLFIGNQWFGSESFAKGLEIWQMLVLAVPIGAMGTMAGLRRRSTSIPAAASFTGRCTSP